jgi:hypothetical protein
LDFTKILVKIQSQTAKTRRKIRQQQKWLINLFFLFFFILVEGHRPENNFWLRNFCGRIKLKIESKKNLPVARSSLWSALLFELNDLKVNQIESKSKRLKKIN